MKTFIEYTPQDIQGDQLQNIVFEMIARCAVDSSVRIIIEQKEEKGERYYMVDVDNLNGDNEEMPLDEGVVLLTGNDDDDEPMQWNNYCDAVREIADKLRNEGFTYLYTETY